ncbi:MAG: two-component system sensor histidine kinase CreC, partial [Proteobacteria bacterium]
IKPRLALKQLLQRSTENLAIGSMIAVISICGFGAILVVLITGPIDALRRYALEVSETGQGHLPVLPHKELRLLADAYEKMRVALEGKKSIEAYTQSLTHELKSPLTVIRGGAELCLEPMDSQQREKFLHNIVDEAARAELILQRLLQISSLETRTQLEKVTRVSLSQVIESVSQSLWSLREANAVSLKVEVPADLFVAADEFLLTQSFRNLLQNAIEFSERGGEILITAKPLGGKTLIEIMDEGTGIPQFAKERLFEKFFSLERPLTGLKGTGLGLTFVQEVIHLHKGEIELHNREPKGTVVRLALPQ